MHTGPSLVIHPLDELMLGGGESSHCHLTLWMVTHLSRTVLDGILVEFIACVDFILTFWQLPPIIFFLLEAFREAWGV